MDPEDVAAACLLLLLSDSDSDGDSDNDEANQNNEQSRKHWVSPLCAARDLEGEMNTTFPRLETDPGSRRTGQFANYFRMEPHLFNVLVERLAPRLQKQVTNMREPISVRDRLGVTLRYFATGHSFNELFYQFRMGVKTISNIIHETSLAIVDILAPEYLKLPQTKDEWKKVADGYMSKWNYPNCVGSLDGKHIVMRKPHGAGSEYHNYKGTESIVLMAVADADQRFIYVSVGSYGRSSDGGIWRDCSLNKALQDGSIKLPDASPLPPLHDGPAIPYHFVADDAFALSPYLMKPHSRRGLEKSQKIYNYRLSRARRIVENCFGRLAAIWRLFQKPANIAPDKLDTIVMACCVLHNFLLDHKAIPTTIDTDAYIQDGSWRSAVDRRMPDLPPRRYGNNPGKEAKEIQQQLTGWFNGVGAVHWQDRMVDYAPHYNSD